MEDGHGLLRAVVGKLTGEETAALVAALRKRLPGCHISYVNLGMIV